MWLPHPTKNCGMENHTSTQVKEGEPLWELFRLNEDWHCSQEKEERPSYTSSDRYKVTKGVLSMLCAVLHQVKGTRGVSLGVQNPEMSRDDTGILGMLYPIQSILYPYHHSLLSLPCHYYPLIFWTLTGILYYLQTGHRLMTSLSSLFSRTHCVTLSKLVILEMFSDVVLNSWWIGQLNKNPSIGSRPSQSSEAIIHRLMIGHKWFGRRLLKRLKQDVWYTPFQIQFLSILSFLH